jgi:hypothetical protein
MLFFQGGKSRSQIPGSHRIPLDPIGSHRILPDPKIGLSMVTKRSTKLLDRTSFDRAVQKIVRIMKSDQIDERLILESVLFFSTKK